MLGQCMIRHTKLQVRHPFTVFIFVFYFIFIFIFFMLKASCPFVTCGQGILFLWCYCYNRLALHSDACIQLLTGQVMRTCLDHIYQRHSIDHASVASRVSSFGPLGLAYV